MSNKSNEFTKFNLGIRGDYKLVKVNGTVPKMMDGYFLRLGKPEGKWGKIYLPAYLQLGNHTWTSYDKVWSDIVKTGKDAEGDIYEFLKPRLVKPGRASMNFESPEAEKFIWAIKNLERMKFGDNFDNLTVITTYPKTTLLFKRFVGERPPIETTNLAA